MRHEADEQTLINAVLPSILHSVQREYKVFVYITIYVSV